MPDPRPRRRYCPDCLSDEVEDREADGVRAVRCEDCGAVVGPGQLIVPPPEPERPPPRFAAGDPVTAFNGEPRVVTGVRWGHSAPTRGCPEITWHWWLDTAHPDDPKCKGCGPEEYYTPRAVGAGEGEGTP